MPEEREEVGPRFSLGVGDRLRAGMEEGIALEASSPKLNRLSAESRDVSCAS